MGPSPLVFADSSEEDETASSEEKTAVATQDPASKDDTPSEFAWLNDMVGSKEAIWCLSGTKSIIPYNATVVSQPFLDNNEWMIQVKWTTSSKREDVSCRSCSRIDQTSSERPRRSRCSHEKKENKRSCASIAGMNDNTAIESPSPASKKRLVQLTPPHGQYAAERTVNTSNSRNGNAFIPFKGMRVKKMFPDGVTYTGHVVSEQPRNLGEKNRGTFISLWKVVYEDGDAEECDLTELQEMCVERFVSPSESANNNGNERGTTINVDGSSCARKQLFDNASANGSSSAVQSRNARHRKWLVEHLYQLPHILPHEADEIVSQLQPPYSLQEAMKLYTNMMDEKEWTEPTVLIEPYAGFKVRKAFGGEYFVGEVVDDKPKTVDLTGGRRLPVWRVRYADGDEEEMDINELCLHAYDKQRQLAPCNGRPFQSLELFCGRGIVSQEFALKKWKVDSVDTNEMSNATMVVDIRQIDQSKDFNFVPDFIWASPPCHTYSRAAHGVHRKPKDGELDRTVEALDQNFLFGKMTEIMRWAKRKHPHLVVVIENPVGLLADMPMMKQFAREFNLLKAKVNYCAFGRGEQKATNLWTNDVVLFEKLSHFTCGQRCPYNGNHPHKVQEDSRLLDFSVIPQPLAYEVARYVDSKFYMNGLQWQQAEKP